NGSINPKPVCVSRSFAGRISLLPGARNLVKTRRHQRNLNWGQGQKVFLSEHSSPLQARSNRVKPTGKTRKKDEHETSKFNSHSNRDRLLRAFTESASSLSVAGRLLSRLHNSGRVQCASTPWCWRRKHRSWLVFALFSWR